MVQQCFIYELKLPKLPFLIQGHSAAKSPDLIHFPPALHGSLFSISSLTYHAYKGSFEFLPAPPLFPPKIVIRYPIIPGYNDNTAFNEDYPHVLSRFLSFAKVLNTCNFTSPVSGSLLSVFPSK